MNEYRCTRPDLYEVGCPGHTDPSARQGHYLREESVGEAVAKMRLLFPKDKNFDIQLWKENVL